MDMNQDYQDRIDQYLMGKMSSDERMVFEQEIENNQELKEQFEFTRDVKDAIVDRNRRLSQIREWKHAYDAKKKTVAVQTGLSRHRYLYWISGIAAVFIAGYFLYHPLVFDSERGSGHPISVNVSSLRSGDDNTDVAKVINEGNYDLALEKIEVKSKKLETEKQQTEQEKDKMDEEEYLYLKEVHEIQQDELNLLKAYALFGLQRSGEALTILDGIRQRDSKFKAQADSLYNLYK